MSSNIKVAVRLKPLDESKKEKLVPGFEMHGRRISLGARSYDPDIAFGANATQDDVFDQCLPIVDAVRNGTNGTIMVYGQTGTGKTYTMFGEEDSSTGIAFRCVDSLLEYVRENIGGDKPAALSLSILEIYNEKITDMLSPEQKEEVQLINGLPRQCRKVTLGSKDEAATIVQKHIKGRHTASTAMNERSSRSHVLLILDLDEEDCSGNVYTSRLVLVDLAGSECLKKSGATGKAAAEAGLINKSLLALKNVILTLSNASENSKPHVPYRDSKLTELLQDSVGGTARTMLIACISAIGRDIEETKSTLDYASKARMIKNVANTERDKLSTKMRSLEIELQRCKNKLSDKINDRGGLMYTKEEHEEVLTLRDDCDRLKSVVAQLTVDQSKLQAKEHIAEGQVIVLKDLIMEKENALQSMKREVAGAAKQVEQATKEIVDTANRAITRVESSSLASAISTHKALAAWQQDPGTAHAKGKFASEVATQCSRAQSAVEMMGNEMIRMNRGFVKKIEEHNTKRAEALRLAVEKLGESLNGLPDEIAVFDGEATDMNTQFGDATSEFAKISTVKNPLDELPIRHSMEDIEADMCRGISALIPPPTLPEQISEAFLDARRSLRHCGKAHVAAVLGRVSSIAADPTGTTAARGTTSHSSREGRPTALAPTKENVVPTGSKRTRSTIARTTDDTEVVQPAPKQRRTQLKS